MNDHALVLVICRQLKPKWILFALVGAASGTVAAQSGNANADSSCLTELTASIGAEKQPEKKPKEPGWLSKHAGPILGVVGGVLGKEVAKHVCDTGDRRCQALGVVGGALLGSELGKSLSEADKKRYQEATYQVALTGRPQSLVIEQGCMVVAAASQEVFEERQVEIALAPSVAVPQRLRAVAEPHARQSPSTVALQPAGQQASRVSANTPLFVMGSIDAGRYLLVGREDPDQGYVAAGYVDAQGWAASPDSEPAQIDGASGQPRVVQVGAEVPCRQVSSSIRIESTNRTETHAAKVCRLPNGISESA